MLAGRRSGIAIALRHGIGGMSGECDFYIRQKSYQVIFACVRSQDQRDLRGFVYVESQYVSEHDTSRRLAYQRTGFCEMERAANLRTSHHVASSL